MKVKRRGRPATGLKHQINLFITAPMYRAVEKYAKEQGVSFSEAARRLLSLGLTAQKEKDNNNGC